MQLQWNPYLTNLYIVKPFLWDTSIQGTHPFRGHKIRSRRNVQIIFVFIISIEGTPLFKERGTFSGSRNPDLTSIQGTPEHSKTDLPLKITITSISWSWFFIHYLAAWNNDCSRFQGGIIGTHFILLVLTHPIIPPWNLLQSLLELLTNPSPTSIQVTLALVLRMSPE